MASPKKGASTKPVIQWDKNILRNKIIKSQVENTWIQLKPITLPGVGEFYFKAGNKDYHLAVTEQTSSNEEEESPSNLKRYKTISELGLKRKYG